MVNETTRNACIRFVRGFTWNRPRIGRGEPADFSPMFQMHIAQVWACWSSFHGGFREWKLLSPNPAWKLRVITPFFPGPRKYQVVQCLYVMILLMTQPRKTGRIHIKLCSLNSLLCPTVSGSLSKNLFTMFALFHLSVNCLLSIWNPRSLPLSSFVQSGIETSTVQWVFRSHIFL